MAVLNAPHEIECNSVKVHFDADKEGHNALNQMHRRIEAELAALLEKLRGEPAAWMVLAANTRKPCEVTLHKSETEVLRQDFVIPLYTLKGQS
ncbi:hypothetical protein WM24_23550 [Burkholderia ubonensis]|nr:hypothetical protein WM24_23550 [Burkholderia ubonensis]